MWFLKNIYIILIVILIYWLPGYWILKNTYSSANKNFLFAIFLSMTIWPAFATFLTLFGFIGWWPIYISLFLNLIIPPLIKQYRYNLLPSSNYQLSKNENAIIFITVCLIIIVTIICRLWTLNGHLSHIWDDYFHIAKFLGIIENGIPASFFRNPNLPLRYSYIYYIPCAMLVSFSKNIISCDMAWFFHTIFSNIAVLGSLIWAAKKMFPNIHAGAVSIFLIICSFGIEWLPYLVLEKTLSTGLSFCLRGPVHGILFEDIFVVLQWVPQHVFGAAISFVILSFLPDQLKKYSHARSILISILFLSMLGSGPFAAMAFTFSTAFWVLIEICIMKDKKQRFIVLYNLVRNGFWVIIFSLPIVILFWPMKSILTVQMPVFEILPQNIWGWLLSVISHMFIEYHAWLIFIIVFFANKIFKKNNVYLRMIFFTFFGITLWTHIFVQDYPTFNNISNRPSIQIFMCIAILVGLAFSKINSNKLNRNKLSIISITIFSLFLPLSGIITHGYESGKYMSKQYQKKSDKIPEWLNYFDQNTPIGSTFLQLGSDVYMEDIVIFGHRVAFQYPESFSRIDKHLIAPKDMDKYKDFHLKTENLPSLYHSIRTYFDKKRLDKPIYIIASRPNIEGLEWRKIENMIDVSWEAYIQKNQIKKRVRWIAEITNCNSSDQ